MAVSIIEMTKSFLPSFAIVKKAKESDSKVAWEVCAHLKPREIAVFDKAYVDFKHLFHLDQREVFWVTRAKDNMQYEVMGQHTPEETSDASDSNTKLEKVMGQQVRKKRKYKRKAIKIISDQRIRLTSESTFENYPQKLPLVVADVEVKKKIRIPDPFEYLSSNSKNMRK